MARVNMKVEIRFLEIEGTVLEQLHATVLASRILIELLGRNMIDEITAHADDADANSPSGSARARRSKDKGVMQAVPDLRVSVHRSSGQRWRQ